jgi:predicted O-linked N-acetylglucosamine transferase (SPINDLY family)
MLSIRTAIDLYEAGRLDEAAEVCTAMLRSDSGHFDALHMLGVVKLAQGDPNEAARLLTDAVKARPRSHEAALNLGLALQSLGNNEGALAQYDRALALRPTLPEALNNRGSALRALGRLDEALESYEQALAQRLDYADAFNNRGAVLLDLGRNEEALTSCQQALAARPDFAAAHFNRGNALAALSRHQRALSSYDEALKLEPGNAAALANKSAIFTLLNRHEEALAAAKAAIALDPGQVDALINCGVAAQHLGRPAEALAAYDLALAASPQSITVLRNRGEVLRELGRPTVALANFDLLIAISPKDADALYGRGEVLRALGRHDESLAAFEQALAIAPSHAGALGGAAFAALNACDWTSAQRLTANILPRVEAGMVVSPFVLLNLTDSPRLHSIGAKNYVREQIKIPPAPFRRESTWRQDKIKIAYLSGDFRQHPVAQLTAELFESHDRSRFEVIGISYGIDDGSPLRERIIKAFDAFHDVRLMGAAKLIYELRVDLLIDLTGYTAGCRPQILAWRPAPIAVNFVGYPGTLGAPFVDYIIADAVVLPFDQQAFYSERIVHLPHCFQPNDTQRKIAAADTPTREAAGLPEKGFVFCCFNNNFKITATMFEVWMELLSKVNDSVLWLLRSSDSAERSLRIEATARGIDPMRLFFARRIEPAEHLARHRLADLFLDTLPYNAHTTGSDALWAGLPVVTVAGSAFAGRVGASLLQAVGLPDLVTPDLAAYKALALRLATEPEALADCKKRLEPRFTAPPFATARYVRHLEAAYAGMHGLWRNGNPPQSFTVNAE